MKRTNKSTKTIPAKRPRTTNLIQINPSKTKLTLHDPTSWSCNTTGTTDDVWCCLGDGRVVSKGSSTKGPAYEHYKRTGYSLYMRLNLPDNPRVAKSFYSQATKRYVMPMQNDPKAECFRDLKRTLTKVRTEWKSKRHATHATNRKMTLGPYLTRDVIQRKQRDDRIATAVYTWKNLIVAKCFHSWLYSARGSMLQKKLTAARKKNAAKNKSSKTKSSSSSSSSIPPPTAPTSISPTRMKAPSFPRRQMSSQVQNVLHGKTGLRNLGNTCYLNALLQVFIHVPTLKHYYSDEMIGILQQKEINKMKLQTKSKTKSKTKTKTKTKTKSKTKKSTSSSSSSSSFDANDTPEITADPSDPALLSRQLVVLTRLSWSSGRATFTPHELLSAIWYALPQFEGHEQHDSQELLVALLDRLHSEEKWLMTQKLTPSNIIEDVLKGCTTTALTYRKNNQIKVSEPPGTAFFGNVSVTIPNASQNAIYSEQGHGKNGNSDSNVVGKRKRTQRSRNDTPVNLYDLLCSIVQPDVFGKEDNTIYKSRATVFESLPRILFVHVNRTSYTASGVKKITGHINFPLTGLDVEQALKESSVSMSSSTSSNASTSASSSCYTLYGIVVHHGRAMNQGHFTAYARVGESWYHFNDHRVTKIKHVNTVLKQAAYLLVYQKEERNVSGFTF